MSETGLDVLQQLAYPEYKNTSLSPVLDIFVTKDLNPHEKGAQLMQRFGEIDVALQQKYPAVSVEQIIRDGTIAIYQHGIDTQVLDPQNPFSGQIARILFYAGIELGFAAPTSTITDPDAYSIYLQKSTSKVTNILLQIHEAAQYNKGNVLHENVKFTDEDILSEGIVGGWVGDALEQGANYEVLIKHQRTNPEALRQKSALEQIRYDNDARNILKQAFGDEPDNTI